MNGIDMLGLLPRAAPLVLRQIAAYAELAVEDLADAQRQFAERLVATAVLIVCCAVALVVACMAVIAVTWDTPYRLQAVAGMFALFVLVALSAAVYRSRVFRVETSLLSSVRREWREDRAILEKILQRGPE